MNDSCLLVVSMVCCTITGTDLVTYPQQQSCQCMFLPMLIFTNILGRPEKLPDVCYSWWVLASLKIIGKIHWINKVC